MAPIVRPPTWHRLRHRDGFSVTHVYPSRVYPSIHSRHSNILFQKPVELSTAEPRFFVCRSARVSGERRRAYTRLECTTRWALPLSLCLCLSLHRLDRAHEARSNTTQACTFATAINLPRVEGRTFISLPSAHRFHTRASYFYSPPGVVAEYGFRVSRISTQLVSAINDRLVNTRRLDAYLSLSYTLSLLSRSERLLPWRIRLIDRSRKTMARGSMQIGGPMRRRWTTMVQESRFHARIWFHQRDRERWWPLRIRRGGWIWFYRDYSFFWFV